MCGIVGLLDFQGQPLDRQVLGEMVAALAHRGPEGQGLQIFNSGNVNVGLGHTRLKIVDLSDAASQPMANEDSSIWVTFNGEIYNYREIRSSLAGRGVRFRTTSDTEVLLRLYEAEGERCVDRLDGMFAFAVWDSRRQCLFLARDRVGKKPLFYYSTPRLFAFASEIKALFRHPEITPDVDVESLPPYFLYGYVPTPATFYRKIRKLPPGHVLRVGPGQQVRMEEYWDLPLSSGISGSTSSEAEVVAKLREMVTAAVRRRLISDVPLGAFLSGGLDSSIVVGLMARLMKEPVRTFSIGFAGDHRFDETFYARLVSQRFGTTHTEFMVEPSAVDLIERLVWHHDGPFADSSAIPTYILSQLTREHVTVALNGDGGDELFAGYLRFAGALLSERVPAWVRSSARQILSALPEWGGHRSLSHRLQRFSSSAALPFFERFSRWVAVFYEDLSCLLPGYNGSGTAPQPLALVDPYNPR